MTFRDDTSNGQFRKGVKTYVNGSVQLDSRVTTPIRNQNLKLSCCKMQVSTAKVVPEE